MKVWRFAMVIAVWGGLCLPGWAPAQEGEQPAEESASQDSSAHEELAAIRAASQEFVRAFNEHDAAAVANLWTEDGDYVDDSGRRYAGREAIAQAYAEYFAASPESKIRILIDSLRMLSDSAAIEDGRAMVEPHPPGHPAVGKYTAVHVKVNGQWLMSTVRDERVETPSNYSRLADLDWLIGDWIAEEHGHKVASSCRWIGDKSFVERRYEVLHADGRKATGVQIIGFNAASGQVQSWDFAADGGHAVGVWTAHEGGWTAEIQGVTGDGASMTAVNHLTRLDDGAYVWRSQQRTLGGASLPDSGEVVIKRKQAE